MPIAVWSRQVLELAFQNELLAIIRNVKEPIGESSQAL